MPTVEEVGKVFEKLPRSYRALLAVLKKQRKQSRSSFVFESEGGGPIDPCEVCGVLYDAEDEAGVRRFGLHGLRHLYTSLLVESGASVKFAQKKLGQASATTTLDIYAHQVTEQGRDSAKKIAEPFRALMLAFRC